MSISDMTEKWIQDGTISPPDTNAVRKIEADIKRECIEAQIEVLELLYGKAQVHSFSVHVWSMIKVEIDRLKAKGE